MLFEIAWGTAGATALMSMRGELPGQSARAHGAANPFGNLYVHSQHCKAASEELSSIDRTVVRDLLVVLDGHCVGGRSSNSVLSCR